jgi:hypothetical protein
MKLALFLWIIFLPLGKASTRPDAAKSRSNQLLNFIAQQEFLRDYALSTMIGARCSTYMSFFDVGPCRDAVKKMIKILDYDLIVVDKKRKSQHWVPDSFVFAAFKTQLLTLLNSAETTDFLKDLNERLYLFLIDDRAKVNIWDVALSHYKSPYQASLALAALFQDTSIKKLHLAYLEVAKIKGGPWYQRNVELTNQVIDTINLILDTSDEMYREAFYPKELVRDLNRNIYHFYVPLHLGIALKRQGVPSNFAYAAPLLLTLTYEFISVSNDSRYILRDPEKLPPNQYHSKLQDIFGSYCGSNFGLRGLFFNKSFNSIRQSFGRSTEEGVEVLLRH